MVNAPGKLWNRDFSLIILVQVLALFGNAILSFALPLHILNISGSPALFGTVLALSFIPLIAMSPIGGVIADRGKKQRIMFCLDLVTAVIIVLYITVSGFVAAVVPIVIVKLMALNVVQGLYMPTTMAAVPFLAPADRLVSANAIANSVFSLSNIIGPVVGGILYAAFGLSPILAASFAIFVIAAVMDLFIRIPYKKQKAQGSVARMLKTDLSRCAGFAAREKPIIGKVCFVMFMFGIPSIAMIIVGLPVLITQTLDMYLGLLGISQGIMMGGGLLGGILAGTLEKKLTIRKAHWLLAACSVSIAPIGLVLLLGAPTNIAYVVITVSGALIMLTMQIVTIQILAFIQLETPKELVGKIIAVAMALMLGSYPAGQLFFGVLLERFYASPWLVMFVAVFMSGLIAVYSRRHFREIGKPM
ncbi:MAG: MFS transporter [Treponema sp.]|nr:MFS transporter [Treponema sp.]